MADSKRNDLYKKLAGYLKAGRLRHSLNAARAAEELAQRFAPDLADKAYIAGLLHDNAKRMTPGELTGAAERFAIQLSPGEQVYPALIHGKVGAALLNERFGIDDIEVFEAVATHVTGQANMGLLSRILFVADQVAEDRSFPGLDELRNVARVDLDLACFMVARFKLRYVIDKRRPVEPATVTVYNELLRKIRPEPGPDYLD